MRRERSEREKRRRGDQKREGSGIQRAPLARKWIRRHQSQRTSEMTQQVKVLLTESEPLSLISGT